MKTPKDGHYWCLGCGEELASNVSHEMVTRVVRAGHKYGDAKAGERVQVETRHVNHPSVAQATMSIEEHDMLHAHAEKSSTEKPVPRLLSMVQQGLEGAIAQTRQQIERGKQLVAHAAKRAAEDAAGG